MFRHDPLPRKICFNIRPKSASGLQLPFPSLLREACRDLVRRMWSQGDTFYTHSCASPGGVLFDRKWSNFLSNKKGRLSLCFFEHYCDALSLFFVCLIFMMLYKHIHFLPERQDDRILLLYEVRDLPYPLHDLHKVYHPLHGHYAVKIPD